MNVMDLQELILYLTKNNNLEINFHDTSNIHSLPKLKLDFCFKMHSKQFCYTAKTTHSGYRLCLISKSLTCKKAIKTREFFYGHCPYGLFELVYPIIYKEKIVSILFIGNCISDLELTQNKIYRSGFITGVDSHVLCNELKNTECADRRYMLNTAKIIETFIISVLNEVQFSNRLSPGQNWVISDIQLYMRTHFRQKITLKEMAKLYFLNEKYVGRLFIKYTGQTFHSYLSELRLAFASKLLTETSKNIIDIAGESGFDSISYFNRSFSKKFGKTPTAYRISNKKVTS